MFTGCCAKICLPCAAAVAQHGAKVSTKLAAAFAFIPAGRIRAEFRALSDWAQRRVRCGRFEGVLVLLRVPLDALGNTIAGHVEVGEAVQHRIRCRITCN